MQVFGLEDFIQESNRIEQIEGFTALDYTVHEIFLKEPVTSATLETFVLLIAHGRLREHVGMNVVFKADNPPKGGIGVVMNLEEILFHVGEKREGVNAYDTHQRYEHLHPFTDGNGRSGRALWLHMMGGIDKVPLGFLHTYYYQSLRV